MAKRLSEGAARLTTPKARLTTSSAVTPGSETMSAPRKICPPHSVTCHRPLLPRPSTPMGSVRKPSTRISSMARWPLSARKVSVTSSVYSCPSTGVLAPRSGSTLKANDRPMLLASSWPPMASASKMICTTKPIATPMTICCAMMTTPAGENGPTVGGGSKGATSSVMAAASNRRLRAGTKLVPKIGATIRQAPMRTKGHRYSATQASICPEVTLSMRPSRSGQGCFRTARACS